MDPEKLDPEATVRVRCCRGVTRTHPTADAQETLYGVDDHVQAEILPATSHDFTTAGPEGRCLLGGAEGLEFRGTVGVATVLATIGLSLCCS